ncbi:hypothetical protein OTU49_011185 [Cherax quadricarinatus]|uniref:Uncharacterized protein n=1 Tax=Cherax quadricarinatus TaxID=27406 RepID=A0AAW0W6Y7_CHEQU|nr:uncharacterized protein LOC128703210 [Cherax quadricarinatus]XP_053653780.1 uncharacterized protein LOC128703210 [Cherax quadricarinatus]XP_053653781.1 uncharacterized protein LOC128703210 [Cherax quadricarinatus]XP_053653782.1 uncharacterized protein LOC128703210 [Cherax quadricarinatus]XP_053653783.1 uncharacterized protein LOC128703210 [Cherax quadricarinatus]
MPALNLPECLLQLALKAVCKNVEMMMTKATHLTESADDVLQKAEEEVHRELAKKRFEELFTGNVSATTRNSYKATLRLKSVKKLLKNHGDFPHILREYLGPVPAVFLNDVFNRVLASVAKIIVYDEVQIEDFMDDKWSFGPRVRVAFHFLMKSILYPNVSTLDISPVTNTFFMVLAEYLMKHGTYKNNIFVMEMEEKKREIFTCTLAAYKNMLVNLTSLSLQNLAHGDLLFLICCHCPNLWHLDISGELFNLQRYCVKKMNAGETAVDEDGTRNYEEADFLDALRCLYGNSVLSQTKYEGVVIGCQYLKTLLLPDIKWEDKEENTLFDEIVRLLLYAPDMEEIKGVSLLYVLWKINKMEHPPIMLKLKKFDGKTGGHSVICVSHKQLKKVHLPFVTEVNIVLNVLLPPVTLEIFPNMRHLTVSPDDYRSYTFDDMMPYLRNLHTLDMELMHELSISNMCDIAENCRSLESLTLTCPALRMQAVALSEDQIPMERPVRNPSPPVARMSGRNKIEYEPHKSLDMLIPFLEYAKVLMKIDPAPYEKDNSQVPNFSRLHTLQFFGVHSVDAAAFYKCIKGSPYIQTLTLVAQDKDDNCNIELDDDFVGRIAPLLKRLRNITLSVENVKNCSNVMKKFTGMAIEHLVKFCSDIRSIGSVTSWNISSDEVKALNYCFLKNNYILRLH